MRDEWVQALAAAVIVLAQAYAAEPWKFAVFARFWDWLAKLAGQLADMFGWMAMHARRNYYDAISVYGG
jgi:hypothetical protein